MRTRLGIFLKAPEPGRVKTRLAARIGPEGAAAVYTAFVLDALSLAGSARVGQRILWWAGAPPSDFLAGRTEAVAREACTWTAYPQCEGDLGERLSAAFAASEDAPLLVLGTDSPDLPVPHLDAALQALENGMDAVFGAAADGGVWCIGLRRAPRGFFDSVPWSSAATGEALRERALHHRLTVFEAEPWYDCDTPEDLAALASRLRAGRSSATMTERWLREQHRTVRTNPSPRA